jgi:hypothetical protein
MSLPQEQDLMHPALVAAILMALNCREMTDTSLISVCSLCLVQKRTFEVKFCSRFNITIFLGHVTSNLLNNQVTSQAGCCRPERNATFSFGLRPNFTL